MTLGPAMRISPTLPSGSGRRRSRRRPARRRAISCSRELGPHETRRTAFSSSSGTTLRRAFAPERRAVDAERLHALAELGERDRERRLGHAVGGEERLLAGSRPCANASAKASSVSGRIGSAPQPATRQRREIEPLELRSPDALHAERVGEVRGERDRALVARDRLEPGDRALRGRGAAAGRRSGPRGRAARARSR